MIINLKALIVYSGWQTDFTWLINPAQKYLNLNNAVTSETTNEIMSDTYGSIQGIQMIEAE